VILKVSRVVLYTQIKLNSMRFRCKRSRNIVFYLPVYIKEIFMITKYTGLKRIFFAGLNSFKGISHCLKYESAFRQEVLFSVILFPVIYFSNISKIEVILLVASLAIILYCQKCNLCSCFY